MDITEDKQKLPATTLVILGVTGDLSRRYLLPSLNEICRSSDIKAQLNIIGLSRHDINKDQVLTGELADLAGQFDVLQLDYEKEDEYGRLKQRLTELGAEQVIYYFAVPPRAVLPIVDKLGKARLNGDQVRLLLEKPFGTDLDTAQKIIDEVNQNFKEEQVYRIDHYLAKEMAQNIAVFLGSNALFRDVWSNQFIEKIEIGVEESIGIEGRVHFYEQTGALRDIIQSHGLQLAALTLMEPCPDVFDFSMMPARRYSALDKLTVDLDSVVIGQYEGYKDEAGNPGSKVETFVALNLKSSNPKWQGVPIQLATGKNLSQRLTEIRIFFRQSQSAQANLLRLRVQPKEGIELELWVKKPGYDQQLQKLPLDFSYQQHFDKLPNAYEQVIVDAIRGRANLFASSREILASWQLLQPVLDNWNKYQLRTYKPGSTVGDILNMQ